MGRHGENIRKRQDGRWEARIIVDHDLSGKAKYRSVYGKTYLEAKEKKNVCLQDLKQQEKKIGKQNKITVQQLLNEWLLFRKKQVKESTYAHYKHLIDTHIKPAIGSIQFSSLTSGMINKYLCNELESGRKDGKGGLSPKTVTDIRSILILSFRYGTEQNYSNSITTQLFLPIRANHPKKILTKEEQLRLEFYLYQHQDPVTIGILITMYSGIRIGELCALRWGDIFFDDGLIKICRTIIRIQNVDTIKSDDNKTRILISDPKTESAKRVIPLPSFILEILKMHRKSKEVFITSGTASYIEPRVYLRKYKQILKKAGLNSFTFHSLRHTFATRCIENGFDTKSLSEILGHANVSTTMQNYVHPSMEMKKAQMNRLRNISIWGQQNGQNDSKIGSLSSFEANRSYSDLL